MAKSPYRRLYIRFLWYLRKKKRAWLRPDKMPRAGQEAPRFPKVAVIGGGTGLSTLLRGLKSYTPHITAIVTVADDGGSSGKIRKDLGILPPGDIRNCILALATAEPEMQAVIDYRFTDGFLEGQSFGNLFIAALAGVHGSFYDAVRKMGEVLNIKGRVLPVTVEDIRLRAEFEDGSVVMGESSIYAHKKAHDCRIRRIGLIPANPPALSDAADAIRQADFVILGPGSLYTSVIPNLLVDGIVDALMETRAYRVYVMNIMTQDGETEGCSASDHIEALFAHANGQKIADACLANDAEIDPLLVARYYEEGAVPIYISPKVLDPFQVDVFTAPLVDEEHGLARHHPQKLAHELMNLYGCHAVFEAKK